MVHILRKKKIFIPASSIIDTLGYTVIRVIDTSRNDGCDLSFRIKLQIEKIYQPI